MANDESGSFGSGHASRSLRRERRVLVYSLQDDNALRPHEQCAKARLFGRRSKRPPLLPAMRCPRHLHKECNRRPVASPRTLSCARERRVRW